MNKSYFRIMVLFVCLILASCKTGREMISDGSIRTGMSIEDFRREMLLGSTPSEDPWQRGGGGYGEECMNYRITFGSNRSVFYIFSPQNKLISSTNTMSQAKRLIDNDTSTTKTHLSKRSQL